MRVFGFLIEVKRFGLPNNMSYVGVRKFKTIARKAADVVYARQIINIGRFLRFLLCLRLLRLISGLGLMQGLRGGLSRVRDRELIF